MGVHHHLQGTLAIFDVGAGVTLGALVWAPKGTVRHAGLVETDFIYYRPYSNFGFILD